MAGNRFRNQSYGSGGGGGEPATDFIVGPFDSLAELKAYDTTATPDNVIANVNEFGLVRYLSSSAVTADDVAVVEPTIGGGRWYKVTTSFSGSVFTVSGDGTADFTTVEAALNALGSNSGIINIVGDTTETGTGTITPPANGQSVTIINDATVTSDDNPLIYTDNTSGIADITLIGGIYDFALTELSSYIAYDMDNSTGKANFFDLTAINKSTADQASFFYEITTDVTIRNVKIELPNYLGCGIVANKINSQNLTVNGGGSNCYLGVLNLHADSTYDGVTLTGTFSASASEYSVSLAGAISNVDISASSVTSANFYGAVSNIWAHPSATGDLYLGSPTADYMTASSIAAKSLDTIIVGSHGAFSSVTFKSLNPIGASANNVSFSNVRVEDFFTAAFSNSKFTNLSCPAGMEVDAYNQSFVNVTTLGGASQTITINAGVEKAVINGARTEVPIVDNGINSNITNNSTEEADWQYFRPTDSKNYIINGGFSVWQRGTSITNMTAYPNTDNEYVIDRWRFLADGSNVASLERDTAFVPVGSTYSCKFTLNLGATKFGVMQVLSSENSLALIGGGDGRPSLQFKIASQVAIAPFSAAVIGWSGAADATTGDPISAWNGNNVDPTLSANWNYRSTPVSISTPNNYSDGLVKIENIEMNASDTNLAVLIWRNGIGVNLAGSTFNIADFKLEKNSHCSEYEQELDSDTISACQYYFQKTYNLDTAPATATPAGEIITTFEDTAGISAGNFTFKSGMRITPTPTFYSPNNGASGNLYNYSTTANAACTEFFRIGQNSGSGLDGTWTVADIAGFHYTLDAEL